MTSRETVARALACILDRQLPSLLHLVHEQAETGRDMGQLLSEIMGAVRELLIAKVAPEEASVSLPEQWRETLAALMNRTPADKIVRLMEILSAAEEHMRWSTNKRLHLEMGLIQAVHSLAEANISDIIRALNGAPLPETPIATTPLPATPLMPSAPVPMPAMPPAPEPQPAAPEPQFEPTPAPMPPGLEPIDDAPPIFGGSALPPEEPSAPSDSPMTPDMWNALVTELQRRAPLKAGMIGNTLFAGDEDGLVTIGIHPADTDTRDALLEDDLRRLMDELAPAICGHNITLRLVTDASVAPPVAEEPPPPPLPEPTPRPKPQPQTPPKPAAAPKPEAPPSLRPTEEEFYHDPLVELALKEFHASIIKQ